LTDIRRQGDIAGNQQNAAAVQAGAFGGSRQGLQSAELGRNVLEQQGRTAAGMRQAGFQNAMQQAQSDFANQQQRQQAQAQFGTQFGQQAFEDAQRRQQAQAQFGTSTSQQATSSAAQAQFGTSTSQQAFEKRQQLRQFGNQQQAFEDAAAGPSPVRFELRTADVRTSSRHNSRRLRTSSAAGPGPVRHSVRTAGV
jgi:hypothetical protein